MRDVVTFFFALSATKINVTKRPDGRCFGMFSLRNCSRCRRDHCDRAHEPSNGNWIPAHFNYTFLGGAGDSELKIRHGCSASLSISADATRALYLSLPRRSCSHGNQRQMLAARATYCALSRWFSASVVDTLTHLLSALQWPDQSPSRRADSDGSKHSFSRL